MLLELSGGQLKLVPGQAEMLSPSSLRPLSLLNHYLINPPSWRIVKRAGDYLVKGVSSGFHQ
jgi:hypothetical protein